MRGLFVWLVGVPSALAACINTNSPDFPGYDPYDDEIEGASGGGAARFIRIEANALERPSDWPGELPEFEPPRGMRIWLDVEAAGGVALAFTGTCEGTWDNLAMLTVLCDAPTPCKAPLICAENGGCTTRRCAADTDPCPAGQVCEKGSCQLEGAP